MSRFNRTVVTAVALMMLVALPALAADPAVNKTATPAYDDNSLVLVTVRASGTDIYGMTLTGDAGAIQDIVAPDGWAGVTDGDLVTFHSVDTPIKSGQTLVFRILVKGSGNFNGTFFDKDGAFTSVGGI